MTKRRTLESALSRTEAEFLFGTQSDGRTQAPENSADAQFDEAVVEMPLITGTLSDGPPHASGFDAPAKLESFASINTRIDPTIGKALTHASFERRMKLLEPASKRAILEVALREWLRRNGYLKA